MTNQMRMGLCVPQGYFNEFDGWDPTKAWDRILELAVKAEELAQLKFGFPQMVLEPDGAVFLVFWCEEDCIKNIRWLRIRTS